MNSPKSTHPSDKQEAQAAIAILRKHDHTAPPKPESHLARIARERREARAATGAAPPPVMPRTKLKRRKTREVIVEVEKKPLIVPLNKLSFHPKLQRVTMLPDLIERETALGLKAGKGRNDHKDHAGELDLEYQANIDSVADHGILNPIKVVQDAKGNWLIADGRHRVEYARKVAATSYADPVRNAHALSLAIVGIPCEEVQPEDVDTIILTALKHRNYSKGALAYLAVLMQPEVAKAISGKHRNSSSAISAEEMAKKSGVSERMMEYAIRLYKTFAERDDARVIFEPSIWVGASLDRLIGGVEHFVKYGVDENETPETEEQKAAGRRQAAFLSFACHLADVGKCWPKWDDLGPVLQETMVKHNIRDAFAGAPPAMRAAAIAALSEEVES
ncbi:MAG: hypothetical protein WCP35_07475 [Verrucomicrobiota bacterium]